MNKQQEETSSQNSDDRTTYYLELLKTIRPEANLLKLVITPLFQKLGYQCEEVHNRLETLHQSDLLLTSEAPSGRRITEGVQVKCLGNIKRAQEVVREIRPGAEAALNYSHEETGEIHRISYFYWITTGNIDNIGGKAIDEHLYSWSTTRGRVEVWGRKELVQQLEQIGLLELLEQAPIFQLDHLAQEHARSNEGIFAAHYLNNACRWHLTHEKGSLEAAKDAVQKAIDGVNSDPKRTLYYYRSLRTYYEMWRYVLSTQDALSVSKHPLDVIVSPAVQGLLVEKYGQAKAEFLVDMEHILRQLEIVSDLDVARYASLTLLHACRLLLRAGFPPSIPAIKDRLNIIAEDFKKEDWRSLDSECSLCTGCAVSCFSLANKRVQAEVAAKWLATLKNSRYSHRLRTSDADATEHALHYAANTLLGLLDYDLQNEITEDILEEFFQSSSQDSAGLPSDWMRFRNIDRQEISRYILFSFSHYFLHGLQLSEERRERLGTVVGALEKYLGEISGDPVSISHYYAARENLSSFAVRLIVQPNGVPGIGRDIVNGLRRRVRSTIEWRSTERKQLWFSSIEHTQIIVEGMLQYWETIFFLEEEKAKSP